MGAFLDHPKVDKINESGDGKKAGESFQYALSTMQGWRIDMEDAHHIIVSLKDQPPFQNWSFFAVFDGHAGSKVAAHSAENLLHTLFETKEFKQLAKEMKEQNVRMNDKIKKLVEEGLMCGFLKLDENMSKLNEEARERSGTTAICAILTPECIFFANLGDSRGVLSRKSGASFGTVDHKPYHEKERDRIQRAGGSVMIQRVNGNLAVSRALGDFEYKSVPNLPQNEQLVSPEPDVYVIDRNPVDDEFLVLACDGIFDVVENDELCELIRSRLAVTRDLPELTNQVLDICLSKGSRDNMTMLLVVFDSAPKVDPVAIERERQWSLKVEEEIKNVIDSLDAHTDLDADMLSNHLKKKEDLTLQTPGGIHLTRSLIHRVLDNRNSSLSSSSTNTGDESTPPPADLHPTSKSNNVGGGVKTPAKSDGAAPSRPLKLKKPEGRVPTGGLAADKLAVDTATETALGQLAAGVQSPPHESTAGGDVLNTADGSSAASVETPMKLGTADDVPPTDSTLPVSSPKSTSG